MKGGQEMYIWQIVLMIAAAVVIIALILTGLMLLGIYAINKAINHIQRGDH